MQLRRCSLLLFSLPLVCLDLDFVSSLWTAERGTGQPPDDSPRRDFDSNHIYFSLQRVEYFVSLQKAGKVLVRNYDLNSFHK